MTEILWLIWSNEKSKWWKPGWSGYTAVLAEAGRYPLHVAEQIVREANFAPGMINEAMILAPESLDLIRAIMAGLGWIEAKP